VLLDLGLAEQHEDLVVDGVGHALELDRATVAS